MARDPIGKRGQDDEAMGCGYRGSSCARFLGPWEGSIRLRSHPMGPACCRAEPTTLKLWDTATGACCCTFEGHSDTVSSVAFSPDGARVLSGSRDTTLKLWDASNGAAATHLRGALGPRGSARLRSLLTAPVLSGAEHSREAVGRRPRERCCAPSRGIRARSQLGCVLAGRRRVLSGSGQHAEIVGRGHGRAAAHL